jgi:hypothetical protein
VTERETARLIAWSHEFREVHARLREALPVTRSPVGDGASGEAATRGLLLFCHGFCAALDSHHQAEDRTLFPAIAAAHPELHQVLRSPEQDHSMIVDLLDGLRAAVDGNASLDELDHHLDGVAAVMENHFRYEERQLLTVLDTLGLDADPGEVLGPPMNAIRTSR